MRLRQRKSGDDTQRFIDGVQVCRSSRLFRVKEEPKRARALIEQCGYWRRKQELEDAEDAAKAW